MFSFLLFFHSLHWFSVCCIFHSIWFSRRNKIICCMFEETERDLLAHYFGLFYVDSFLTCAGCSAGKRKDRLKGEEGMFGAVAFLWVPHKDTASKCIRGKPQSVCGILQVREKKKGRENKSFTEFGWRAFSPLFDMAFRCKLFRRVTYKENRCLSEVTAAPAFNKSNCCILMAISGPHTLN